MHDAGAGWRTIAGRLHVSPNVVKGILGNTGKLSSVSRETAKAVQLGRQSGLSMRAIGRRLGLAHTSVQRACRLLAERPEYARTEEEYQTGLKRDKENICRLLSGSLRGLLVFDLHAPHIYWPALRDALKAKGPFDYVVIGGDAMDVQHFSTFRKTNAHTLAEEIKVCMEAEESLCQKAPVVIKIRGNHEDRIEKRAFEHLNDLMGMMEGKPRAILSDAVRRISDWYLNPHPAVRVHADWWLAVGDPERPNIISHPDRYMANRLSAPQAISRYFADRGIRPQSLCVGHLHRYVPWTPIQGVWQSEMPAMCLRMSYMNAARAYGGALHAGYGVLVTKKGAFVPNESYVHFSASL